MNLVRSFISIFLLALIAVTVAGWVHASSMPSPKLEGARFVLVVCGVASLGCLWTLWSVKPMDATDPAR